MAPVDLVELPTLSGKGPVTYEADIMNQSVSHLYVRGNEISEADGFGPLMVLAQTLNVCAAHVRFACFAVAPIIDLYVPKR